MLRYINDKMFYEFWSLMLIRCINMQCILCVWPCMH